MASSTKIGSVQNCKKQDHKNLEEESIVHCVLGHTDSTKVTMLLTASVPSLLDKQQHNKMKSGYTSFCLKRQPCLLPLLFSLVFMCEHKALVPLSLPLLKCWPHKYVPLYLFLCGAAMEHEISYTLDKYSTN